jgi:hypothetical protein
MPPAAKATPEGADKTAIPPTAGNNESLAGELAEIDEYLAAKQQREVPYDAQLWHTAFHLFGPTVPERLTDTLLKPVKHLAEGEKSSHEVMKSIKDKEPPLEEIKEADAETEHGSLMADETPNKTEVKGAPSLTASSVPPAKSFKPRAANLQPPVDAPSTADARIYKIEPKKAHPPERKIKNDLHPHPTPATEPAPPLTKGGSSSEHEGQTPRTVMDSVCAAV